MSIYRISNCYKMLSRKHKQTRWETEWPRNYFRLHLLSSVLYLADFLIAVFLYNWKFVSFLGLWAKLCICKQQFQILYEICQIYNCFLLLTNCCIADICFSDRKKRNLWDVTFFKTSVQKSAILYTNAWAFLHVLPLQSIANLKSMRNLKLCFLVHLLNLTLKFALLCSYIMYIVSDNLDQNFWQISMSDSNVLFLIKISEQWLQ